MQKVTPMMAQYYSIKEQYKDTILFFRLGDFYEMFYEDAETASRELEITLTGRPCGNGERAPMCGVPFHSADLYIARLVEKGYKVAICEQTEDPKNCKGIVGREVIRIITPGTTLDENLLDAKGENYICSFMKDGNECGLTFCEASTGNMMTTYFTDDADGADAAQEIGRMRPAEVIYNIEGRDCALVRKTLEEVGALGVLYNDAYFTFDYAEAALEEQFGAKNESLAQAAVRASGALLSYLVQTQKQRPVHITEISMYTTAQFMELDLTAINNLELCLNMRNKKKRDSLYWVLDKTETPMGSRTIKAWLLRPLMTVSKITARHASVEELTKNQKLLDSLKTAFGPVSDMERLTTRVVMGSANPRDLLKLQASLAALPEIKDILKEAKSPLLCEQEARIDPLPMLSDLIFRAISEDAPISIREGGIIKDGFSEELDALRRAQRGGSDIIHEIEAEERERTDIKNLRVRYNKVFGYYIEVSKSNLSKVPEDYIRKQTIAGGERYITEKLKEAENIILGASEKIDALEHKIFQEIRETIAAQTVALQRTAHALGTADALCSLAQVAIRSHFVRPVMDDSDVLEIRGGRHAVVECALKDTLFVPNDTLLDTDKNRLAIITGPNMAGKSTYMRQIALIAIMAQMGSFVPADACRMGIIDKVYTRIGASDDLSTGRSTFMVEMSEMADILSGATKNSLLILDEIGRGTSTYDGLSIAWAVLEHCALKIGAKTLFATHYHELTRLEERMEGVVNYNIAARKRGEDIIFLRKIVRGGTDDSYGIEVARLAGVPQAVTTRARQILKEIEEGGEGVKIRGKEKKEEETPQLGMADFAAAALVEELKAVQAETLSPIEAMNILYRFTQKAKEL